MFPCRRLCYRSSRLPVFLSVFLPVFLPVFGWVAFVGGLLTLAPAVSATPLPAKGRAVTRPNESPRRQGVAVKNGLPAASLRKMAEGGLLDPEVIKYAARCALPKGMSFSFTSGEGKTASYPGAVGLAPEWVEGACDVVCQEKLSSCLAAHINRTGKHVNLTLVSAAPSMEKTIGADNDDLTYPSQEGAFFGNFWTEEVFACQGRDVTAAAQVKRFCAADPQSCNTQLKDAGPCVQACDFSCGPGTSGRKVCSAVSCRDPRGRIWHNPITVFVRNKIEASNADRLQGASQDGEELVKLSPGAEATYRQVDFGGHGRLKKEFVALVKDTTPGTGLEVWVDGKTKVTTLTILAVKSAGRELAAPLRTAKLQGRHDLTLKITGSGQVGRLSHIEIR